MKLPYWLLRLLPMWDYICPRCRREVKPNSHQCPYCGERFPFPLRVPPKCLKRKEDLERYVHEKIFPKISDWQREYLAQYFTTIFQSGFETGDFSEWTATEQPNGIASVQSITKHHGNYAAKFETTSTAVGSYAAAYKNIAATSLVYMRFYLYLDNLPGVNNSRLLYGQLHNVANGYILLFYVNRGSIGNLRWELRLWTGGTLVSYYSANENIQTNQWYCVEMKLKVHGTQGEIALWIDGVQKIAQTGLDTDDRGNVDRVYVTCFISTTAQDAFKSCKIDCVVVADTYTGPEFKQWSQTLNIVHMLERPFRSIRLMQALKAAYV
ncbi:MAG: heparin lyase I family protein, partial [Candidatus Bathyarchaeia archaeon]